MNIFSYRPQPSSVAAPMQTTKTPSWPQRYLAATVTHVLVLGPGRGFIAGFCTTLIISTINQIILLPWPLPWPARPGSGWPPQPQVGGASVGILLSCAYFPRPATEKRRQIASHLIFVFARVWSVYVYLCICVHLLCMYICWYHLK